MLNRIMDSPDFLLRNFLRKSGTTVRQRRFIRERRRSVFFFDAQSSVSTDRFKIE
ncbi:MAG: hypothetical protein HC767_04760 [Akkermansiaceae bacterium]|nr:hypothetical protein [Akkermansiaceae bacterium]